MITQIEDYFLQGCGRCERFATADCATRKWAEGLVALRQLCVGMKLVEALKCGHPCYVHEDRNIAIIGALRGDFRLSFFNAALMKDPAGVLVRQGPNTRHPDMIRFTDNGQVAAMEETLRDYLAEAMRYAEAGIRPPKETGEAELPPELAAALASDPALAQAFHGLTPGRQRSYVLNLSTARKSATRISRIAAFRERILAGKGALEQ